MKPLYTETEYKDAKSIQLLPLQCIHCTKTFYRTKHYIQATLLPNSQATAEYCNARCLRHHETPPMTVICNRCGNTFNKKPSAITLHNFCSRSCAAIYTSTHKTKGTRISKLEIWLSKKLPELYPNIEFHFNRTDAINGELDIYIPLLKLAFELNGIFHYEPIYGSEKLAKMQTNDARKMLACAERDISLYVIDVSHQKYFKEQRALEFLPIVTNIINSKLSESSPVTSDCPVSTI